MIYHYQGNTLCGDTYIIFRLLLQMLSHPQHEVMTVSEVKFLVLHSLQELPLKGVSPETGTRKLLGWDIPLHGDMPEAFRGKHVELPDKCWRKI